MWIFTAIVLLTSQAFAGEVPVQLLSGDVTVEEIVSQSASHASADIKGKGASIRLTYSTLEPLSVFVLYKGRDGSLHTFDTLQTVLPAGKNLEATIDLTKSPGWQPMEQAYRLYFFSRSDAGAIFHDIEFNQASWLTVFSTAIHHAVMKQPYSPASYHRLPGYSILGIPLTVAVGLVMMLVVVLLILIGEKNLVIPVTIIIVLITQARFSLDAVALSVEHSRQWLSHKTYSTAGSLPAIAQKLLEEGASSVFLCHTGTTYAHKLLQYHAYPVILSGEDPEYIVVHKSSNWSYDDDRLRCDDTEFSVDKVKDYNDGSALFKNNI